MDACKSRLRPEDWLEAGLRVLSDGHEAVRLTRLVKETGATTGSFYWHFAGIDRYRRALTSYWVDSFLPTLARHATETAASPEQTLERLGELILVEKGYAIDAAMRRWSNTSAYAQDAVRKADIFRREVILVAAKMRGVGKEITDEQYALLGVSWRGSDDMSDQKARMKLISMVTDTTFDSNN